MHKHHAPETSYGTLGQAVYDTDLKKWEFNRDPNGFEKLRPVGIEGIAAASHESTIHKRDGSHVSDVQQKKLLSSRYPELIPAIPLLSRLAIEEAIAEPVSNLDIVHNGDLVSLGRALDFDNRKVKSAYRLLAFPDENHNADLRIHLLRTDYYKFARAEKDWLAIPRNQEIEPGWWRSKGGPIQQTCFAPSTDEQSTLLAVRTPQSISVLKPLYRQRPVIRPGPSSSLSSVSESCIDANPLIIVSCDNEPGSVFVDVSFNPWYRRQVVVADSDGRWIIYEIKGKANSKKPFRALRVESNVLCKTDLFDCHPTFDSEDKGWGRVLWINDVNMILVCNRLDLAVFDMEDEISSTHHIRFELGKGDIILDVQKCIGIDDLLIILTSSIISLIRVNRKAQHKTSSHSGTSKAYIETIHTWRHNRDQADRSLRMCHAIDKCYIRILLYSRRKSFLSLHTIAFHQNGMSLNTILHNPTDIQHNSLVDEKARDNHILTILFEPLKREKAKIKVLDRVIPPSSTGPRVSYHMLYILWSDFSIIESVYYILEQDDVVNVEKLMLVRKGPLSRSRIGTFDFAVSDNGYIENTRSNDSAPKSPKILDHKEPFPLQNTSRPRMTGKARVRGGNLGVILRERTSSYEFPSSLPSFVQTVRRFLLEDSISDSCSTWHFHIGSRYNVHDIDEASQALEDALSSRSQKYEIVDKNSTALQIIPINLRTCVSSDGMMRLSVLYEYLVAHWLASLPVNVPSKVRVAKEKFARHLAAELCLASVIFRHGEEATEGQIGQIATLADGNGSSQSHPPASQESYPDKRQDSSFTASEYGQELRSSSTGLAAVREAAVNDSVLPTPSATPSVVSSSSTYTAKSMKCSVLNAYGYFPSTGTLPKTLARCLTTWKLDENPYFFDGDTAIETVTRPREADEDNEDGVSAAERRRLKRRAERLLKRQRREAAKSSGIPANDSNSVSLQLRPADVLSSSQVTAGKMPAAAIMSTQGSSSQPMTLPKHIPTSSQMPFSSQKTEKIRSSGAQTAGGSVKKRRRLAGF